MKLRKKINAKLEKKTQTQSQIQILNHLEMKQVVGGTDTSAVLPASEDTLPDMSNGLGRLKTCDVTLER